MALTGVHITIGRANVTPTGNGPLPAAPLLSSAISAQTMTSAGTSTIAAPSSRAVAGELFVLSISAAIAIFYTTGATPADPSLSASPRRYLDPGSKDIYINPGDKFAWAAA